MTGVTRQFGMSDLSFFFQYKREIFEVTKTVNAVLRSVRFTLRLPFQNS
jgi:hypothetical protein